MVQLSLTLGPGEPAVTEWEPSTFRKFADNVLARCGDIVGRPAMVAVDGRSGAGKTSVARALTSHVSASVVVHTDDVAWYESFFGWDTLLATEVLGPLRESGSVNYRPDAWVQRGREGSIVVPRGLSMVVVEGCGAGRSSLMPCLDVLVWVQTDSGEAERRGIARDGDTVQARRFWREWQAQEDPFFLDDRPWTRANLFVCGSPRSSIPPGFDVLTAGPDHTDR